VGDGVAEQVRLEEQQVVVYRNGVEVWRGLPEWRVVDLALGDPNDDGRNEMLLALWNPDTPVCPAAILSLSATGRGCIASWLPWGRVESEDATPFARIR